jgi:hypothetical protein
MLDEKLGIMLKIKKSLSGLVELLYMGSSTASLAVIAKNDCIYE